MASIHSPNLQTNIYTTEGDLAFYDKCMHIFHKTCIESWLDHQSNEQKFKACPACRSQENKYLLQGLSEKPKVLRDLRTHKNAASQTDLHYDPERSSDPGQNEYVLSLLGNFIQRYHGEEARARALETGFLSQPSLQRNIRKERVLLRMAETHPQIVAERYPHFMAQHHPFFMAEFNPQFMAKVQPHFMTQNHPMFMLQYDADFVLRHYPDLVAEQSMAAIESIPVLKEFLINHHFDLMLNYHRDFMLQNYPSLTRQHFLNSRPQFF